MQEELILEAFKQTLTMIAGDYPNATEEYKRKTFVIGAQDMTIQLAKLAALPLIPFARKVDAIRNKLFP